jgi:phosphonate utilization transcriptional regulator
MAMKSSTAVLRPNTLPALIQQEIERLVLNGELKVGTRLSENELGERLGVSRSPVREALRTLEGFGLVRQEPNRGVYVRLIRAHEAAELYEIRSILDQFVGRALAERASAEQLSELKALLAKMKEAAERSDPNAYFPLNLEFHDRMVRFTGNRKLLVIYRQLTNELRLFRHRLVLQSRGPEISYQDHRRIVARIAARDREGAGQAMAEHAMRSRERLLQFPELREELESSSE